MPGSIWAFMTAAALPAKSKGARLKSEAAATEATAKRGTLCSE
jgi:hypothetical protein